MAHFENTDKLAQCSHDVNLYSFYFSSGLKWALSLICGRKLSTFFKFNGFLFCLFICLHFWVACLLAVGSLISTKWTKIGFSYFRWSKTSILLIVTWRYLGTTPKGLLRDINGLDGVEPRETMVLFIKRKQTAAVYVGWKSTRLQMRKSTWNIQQFSSTLVTSGRYPWFAVERLFTLW